MEILKNETKSLDVSESTPVPQPARNATRTPDRPNEPDVDHTLITIENLQAWYGDFQAINGLSLKIPKHKVTAFIGPSGCGKSTLLKWINRMNDVVPAARAKGRLSIEQHDNGEGPSQIDVLDPNLDVVGLRRKIGIVFQKPNPFPKSIYDNVAFGPRLHMKTSKSELAPISICAAA